MRGLQLCLEIRFLLVDPPLLTVQEPVVLCVAASTTFVSHMAPRAVSHSLTTSNDVKASMII